MGVGIEDGVMVFVVVGIGCNAVRNGGGVSAKGTAMEVVGMGEVLVVVMRMSGGGMDVRVAFSSGGGAIDVWERIKLFLAKRILVKDREREREHSWCIDSDG